MNRSTQSISGAPATPSIFQDYQHDAGAQKRKIAPEIQALDHMRDLLAEAGHKNFETPSAWERCLCVIIHALKPSCKVLRILESLPHGRERLDQTDVLNTLAHLGYFCSPVACKMGDIDPRLLPALFVTEEETPCVILRQEDNGACVIFNPLSGDISEVYLHGDKADGVKALKGKLWIFRPFDESLTPTSKFMRKGSGHSWFRALLGRFKGTFAQVMAAGFILNLIALITPLFIMLVYDRVIAAAAPDILPMLALGAFIAIAFEWVLRSTRSEGLSWLAGRLDNIVGNKIFSHLIGLSPSLIEKASVPAQIARIKTFESVRDFFSGSVFLSLLEAPFVILSVLAIALIAGKMVLVPLMMVSAYIGLFLYIRSKIKVSIRIAAKSSSARQQFSIDTFEKLEGIRAHGLDKKWQEKFRHLSGREMDAHFNLGFLGMVAETCAHMLTVISAVITVGFGVHFVWAGEMSTGALVATMILVWRVLTPFYSLCTMIPRLEQLRNSIIQVNKLIDIDTEAEEAKSFSRLPKIRGRVTFLNAGLRYGKDSDPIFENLSFDARSGDLVVVTGSNGTGKGSVFNLVQGMYRADTGSVLIDGFDIRQLDATDMRRKIAYVPKQAQFFHGSIIDNMRLSNPVASMEEVERALKLADAWDDVCDLPYGLNTVIGSSGQTNLTVNLSTRLSLARAYLNPASILLIDELPNTLLVGKTGRNLKAYLARAKGKRTVIMASYRDDYLKLADTVVWLKGRNTPVCMTGQDIINTPELTGKGIS